MKNTLKFLDYVYLTRPILWFPGWTTLLAGYLSASGDFRGFSFADFHFLPLLWAPGLFLAMISFGFAMGGVFILNQLKDVDSDRINEKLFLLGEGLISLRAGYLESFVLIAVSLFIAATINTPFLIATVIFIIHTGYVYNYPPFELKSYPLRGLIANTVMGWLAFFSGWLLLQPPGAEMFFHSLPYFFYNAALCVYTTVPDIEGDRSTGKITVAVKYGLKASIYSGLALFILAIIFAAINQDAFLLLICLANVPLWIKMFFSKSIALVIVNLKLGIFFLSLGVCVKFPFFLLLICAAYFITRFYYKHRFNVDYPNFKGE